MKKLKLTKTILDQLKKVKEDNSLFNIYLLGCCNFFEQHLSDDETLVKKLREILIMLKFSTPA